MVILYTDIMIDFLSLYPQHYDIIPNLRTVQPYKK